MTSSLAGLLVGRTLADRYAVQELIGRGGMSLVYRAVDERLHRAVAVKVISLPSGSEQQHRDLRERLRREAAAAARVPPHPNVVQVYDYGTDTALDLDFIAMELLEGEDLRTILGAGRVPYGEAIRILRETARGLAAGHRVGIVHRDVKPGNIVVLAGASRTVKVLDFGIAKALEGAEDADLTRTGQAPHSPAWASPEQLRRGEPVTPASDVYQLGLVAHELLTGERAEGGIASRGERWQAVPSEVRAVVETSLHPDPARRYRDAAGFAEALARAAAPEEGTMAFHPPTSADAAAPPLPPGPDDQTALDPGPATASPRAAPATAPAAPARGSGLPRRAALLAAAALAAFLLLRGLSRDDAAPLDSARPIAPEIEILDAQFRGLMEEAHRNLPEVEDGAP